MIFHRTSIASLTAAENELLEENSVEHRLVRAEIALRQGKPSEARVFLENTPETDLKAALLNGHTHRALGNHEEAARLFSIVHDSRAIDDPQQAWLRYESRQLLAAMEEATQ